MIPIWKKLSLSTQEAAQYTNINVAVIQALVNLSKLNKSDFPYFRVGTSVKIPRVALERWIERLNETHPTLSLQSLREQLVTNEGRKVGRPRKQRG